MPLPLLTKLNNFSICSHSRVMGSCSIPTGEAIVISREDDSRPVRSSLDYTY